MKMTVESDGKQGERIETGTTILTVDGISRSFGPLVALRDLSFEARAGEVIGLLGPNGAGKTTAMRVLSTILAPMRGSFTLDGIPHTRPVEVKRRLGVLPESSGYPRHWTGVEYLRYYARLNGHSPRSAREVAANLLVEVGLAERGTSRIGAYSRGMKQRLGVARALVNSPKVIFLDEPTLGLDPAGQRQMLELIRDLAKRRGAAVLLSTHFLDEVDELCSRVIILNRGAVIASGTVSEIKRRAAPTSVRVRVDHEKHDEALEALAKAAGVSGVDSVEGHPDTFTAAFDRAWLNERDGSAMNGVLGTLIEANVPVLSFELEGGRLSDAFLALTEAGE